MLPQRCLGVLFPPSFIVLRIQLARTPWWGAVFTKSSSSNFDKIYQVLLYFHHQPMQPCSSGSHVPQPTPTPLELQSTVSLPIRRHSSHRPILSFLVELTFYIHLAALQRATYYFIGGKWIPQSRIIQLGSLISKSFFIFWLVRDLSALSNAQHYMRHALEQTCCHGAVYQDAAIQA